MSASRANARVELGDRLLEKVGVGVVARALGNAVDVLASQLTRFERAPDGRAVAVLLEDALVLAVDLARVEERKMGLPRGGTKRLSDGVELLKAWYQMSNLVTDGANHVEPVGNVDCLGDLLGRPLRRAPVQRRMASTRWLQRARERWQLLDSPVEGEALVDTPVEGANRLLNRRRNVRPVSHDDVDVLKLQSLERRPETCAKGRRAHERRLSLMPLREALRV